MKEICAESTGKLKAWLGKNKSLKSEDMENSTKIKMLTVLYREVRLHGHDHTMVIAELEEILPGLD